MDKIDYEVCLPLKVTARIIIRIRIRIRISVRVRMRAMKGS